MNASAEMIKTRCYWEAIVRPKTFVESRVANRHVLQHLIGGAAITYQGFPFPFVNQKRSPDSGSDWIGQFEERPPFLELWRVYLSGQFYHLSSNPTDWGYEYMLSPFASINKGDHFIGVGYALFRYTIVYELAARLALTDLGDDEMHVELKVGNLGQHRLVADDPNRADFLRTVTAGLDEIPSSLDISRAELVANPRQLALRAAQSLFRAFDVEMSEDVLRGWQEQWLRR